MIRRIRFHNQQLANPAFDNPAELVRWMGAVQAQDFSMVKWAVGMRLRHPSAFKVEESLRKGEILRIHILRPTWHLVSAEDIRWMLKLSEKRIYLSNNYVARKLDISPTLYTRCNRLLVKMLEGNNYLTREEVGIHLAAKGIRLEPTTVNKFVMYAEAKGIICNGVISDRKITYALLDERVPPAKDITRQEALRKLAEAYFRSHSPAGFDDFVWWSGLPAPEARQAIGYIQDKLLEDTFEGSKFYVYDSPADYSLTKDIVHLLPSYDEYLISYKDRTAMLPMHLQPKAFNNSGIFYPVIVYNGKIVGNWKKGTKKGNKPVITSLFENDFIIDHELMEAAEERYRAFYP